MESSDGGQRKQGHPGRQFGQGSGGAAHGLRRAGREPQPRDLGELEGQGDFNENLARVAEQYLKKGSKVYVEGQLQTRKWTDQSGQEKYSTEVVIQRFRGDLTILDGRQGGAGGDYDEQAGQVSRGGDFGRSSPMERRPATAGAGGGGRRDDLDDDIPF